MSKKPSNKSATHPMQDYKSRVSDPASRKFETFSYIPRMDDKAIRRQAQYLVARGWIPAIEHVEPDRSAVTYWYMWKLPMFGEKNVDAVLQEAAACREANPDNHIRLVGYDPIRQSLGASMVVYRGKGY